jgi:hypothetical protein
MPEKEKKPNTEPAEAPATAESEEKGKESTREFMVLSIGLKSKVGASFKLLGIAHSLEKAKKIAESVEDTGVQRLAIAEKKVVILRKPAITVNEVAENIIKD